MTVSLNGRSEPPKAIVWVDRSLAVADESGDPNAFRFQDSVVDVVTAAFLSFESIALFIAIGSITIGL